MTHEIMRLAVCTESPGLAQSLLSRAQSQLCSPDRIDAARSETPCCNAEHHHRTATRDTSGTELLERQYLAGVSVQL